MALFFVRGRLTTGLMGEGGLLLLTPEWVNDFVLASEP